MAETDFEYFQRRAAEERGAAQRARHPSAREAHLELADRYEDLANAIGGSVHMVEPELRVLAERHDGDGFSSTELDKRERSPALRRQRSGQTV